MSHTAKDTVSPTGRSSKQPSFQSLQSEYLRDEAVASLILLDYAMLEHRIAGQMEVTICKSRSTQQRLMKIYNMGVSEPGS